MTNPDTKALREALAKATPGPWDVQPINDKGYERGVAFIVGADLGGMVGAGTTMAYRG